MLIKLSRTTVNLFRMVDTLSTLGGIGLGKLSRPMGSGGAIGGCCGFAQYLTLKMDLLQLRNQSDDARNADILSGRLSSLGKLNCSLLLRLFKF